MREAGNAWGGVKSWATVSLQTCCPRRPVCLSPPRAGEELLDGRRDAYVHLGDPPGIVLKTVDDHCSSIVSMAPGRADGGQCTKDSRPEEVSKGHEEVGGGPNIVPSDNVIRRPWSAESVIFHIQKRLALLAAQGRVGKKRIRADIQHWIIDSGSSLGLVSRGSVRKLAQLVSDTVRSIAISTANGEAFLDSEVALYVPNFGCCSETLRWTGHPSFAVLRNQSDGAW